MASVLVARRQGLVFQERLTVAGVPCTLMARSDPRAMARPRLLFFVHGGGFVAHLFLADMPVLTAWTTTLGAEGALLIPEYTLVPEGRYPKPTTELLGVYKAVLEGGLGFTPHRVAVAGGKCVACVRAGVDAMRLSECGALRVSGCVEGRSLTTHPTHPDTQHNTESAGGNLAAVRGSA